MASYEQVIGNQNSVDRMYYALQALGKDIAPDASNEQVVDDFLTASRYLNTNLFSTLDAKSKVDEMDDTDKQLLARSLKEIEDMPNFGEGSAPTASAIGDYLLAGVSDPTNLLSVIAGAFTLGAGGAASLGAKQAAKYGFKKQLQAKLNAAVSRPVIKSLAAEGVVAGSGGAFQNYKLQELEKDIGMRKDINPSLSFLQGILEGTLSPVAGVGINLGSFVVGSGIKGGSNALFKNIPAYEQAKEFLGRNFLPTAGLEETTRRLIERRAGQASSPKDKGRILTEQFKSLQESKFSPDEIRNEEGILNKALQNDPESLKLVNERSPEMGKVIDSFFSLRDEVLESGKEANVSKALKTTFSNVSNPNYVRSVPEAFAVRKRLQNFDSFIKDNPEIINDIRIEMLADPTNSRWVEYTNKYIGKDGSEIGTDDQINAIVKDTVKSLYSPTRRFKKETGVFEAKKTDIPDSVRKVLGYNNNPALRITETINGIVDTVARANTAKDLVGDAVRRGVAVKLDDADPAQARALLGGDVIPFAKAHSKVKGADEKLSKDFAMDLPLEALDDSVKNVYILRNEGKKLNEIFDKTFFGHQVAEQNNILGATMRGFLGTQAFSKGAKTLFSPIAHIRNALGAVGHVTASGNVAGLKDSFGYFNKLSNAKKKELVDEFTNLGLQGSNIDLNQTLRRFGDVTDNVDDGTFLQNFLTSGGLSVAGKPGKKIAKKSREIYGGIDDAAKFGILQNEKRKAIKIFDNFSPEDQQARLVEFGRKYGISNPTKKDYILEEAAVKTSNISPVYGRISTILEKSRSFPVVGTFTAYPAERLRNTYNILRIATDEMKEGFETGNSVLRNQGIKRLAQWYATQGSLYTMAYGLNEAAGNSETLEKMRSSLAPWEKDAALLITGKNKDGLTKYTNLSYVHPDQGMLDSVIPMMLKASRGEDVAEDLDKSLMVAGFNLFKPYVTPSLAFEAASSLGNIVKGTVEAVGGRDYDPSQDLFNIAKTVEPGYSKIVRDMAQTSSAYEKFGELGTDAERFMYPQRFGVEPPQAEDFLETLSMNGLGLPGLGGFPGLKENVFDPKKVIGYTLNTLNSNAKQNFNTFAKDLKDKLSDTRFQYEMDDILEDYNDILMEQFEAQKGIHTLFRDMEGLVGRGQLKRHLNSLGLSGVVPSQNKIGSALVGKFNPVTKAKQREFWLDLAKDLYDKTGMSYSKELNALRKAMYKMEAYYQGRSLKGNTPDIHAEN